MVLEHCQVEHKEFASYWFSVQVMEWRDRTRQSRSWTPPRKYTWLPLSTRTNSRTGTEITALRDSPGVTAHVTSPPLTWRHHYSRDITGRWRCFSRRVAASRWSVFCNGGGWSKYSPDDSFVWLIGSDKLPDWGKKGPSDREYIRQETARRTYQL